MKLRNGKIIYANTMKSLDLFCGTKSFSKVAEEKGFECTTLDILEKFNPTICCDLMDWDYKEKPVGYYDVIWASPNCKDYSSMNFLSGKDKDLTESNNLIKRVLEIIDYYKPKYWFIENPQTGKLKHQDFMINLPYNDIDYCKYGFEYRKRTRIWNNSNWTGKILCKKNHYCSNKETNGKHNMKWITRGGGSSKWEHRIMIPKELMEEIIDNCLL
jgi:site-specific DNA-cytosine methylase